MKWDVGYIYEGFLVWTHRSVMWAYITDFPVVTLLTVSFHAHMCLYSRYAFPVHVCLICTPLGFIKCTHGLHPTTLNPHVQILESGSWWLCCSWSEWRSGSVDYQLPVRTLFIPVFPWSARKILILLLVSTFSSFYIVYHALFASWWSYILDILYHALW